MKKLITISALLFSGLCAASTATQINNAQTQTLQANLPTATTAAIKPTEPLIIPAAPKIDASAYALMDANSGKIIASKNLDKRFPPASLTKLMTLYIVEKALGQGQVQLTDKVHISNNAWKQGGSRMFVKLNSSVPVQKLMEGIIVASGNDASTALAEYIGGNVSTFVDTMNQTAASIGMKNTHYMNPTGLPMPNHYSSAGDLAILAQHVINNYPQYYQFYKEKWISFNSIRQPNRNRLLWRDPSVDGLKTGHTSEAGYCLISSADRHGMRLISVVMGTPTDEARASSSDALINWGFHFYKTYKIYAANQAITSPRIFLGTEKNVAFGLTKDLYITIPTGEYSMLKANMQLQPKLKAPISKGQAYGTINITLAGKPIASAPLVALQDDPIGGAWTRMTDHLSMFIKGL